MNSNRVRWFPADHLPMQSVATTRLSGVFALAWGLALTGLLVWLLPDAIGDGDTEGVVVLSGFGLAAIGLALWGLHQVWYKKTTLIDDQSVHIRIRTLRGTSERSLPLARYGAIVQMDSRLQWWKFSSLVLPDPDPRFTVCLALTRRGSRDLPELRDHFAKLLQLRCETIWSLD